jgi:cytochrome P450
MENKMSISRYPEDSWPLLNKLPTALTFWRKRYEADAEIMRKTGLAWWIPCKERVKRGVNIPCVATDFVKTYQADGWSDEDASLVALGLMMAGAGTTSATLSFFIMACCSNPDALRRAHEELDAVVGDQRLPTLEDEPDLPYIRAMIKENLRWRPISNHGWSLSASSSNAGFTFTNLEFKGMLHATTKEDYYKGYRIPKGARIIPNAYSIHQDTTKYKNPDSFQPERYLNYPHAAVDAINLKDPNERDHFAYGAGRRVCAGIHVAEISIFIAVSHLLWCFNIENAKDKNGRPIPINTLGYNGKLPWGFDFCFCCSFL